MSGLSTHILDTSSGRAAAGIGVSVYWQGEKISSSITDSDGRCPSLLPPDAVLMPGVYRLVFETGTHFENGFYPEVSISFIVRDATAHHHVPLLISPFGYTTYRGS